MSSNSDIRKIVIELLDSQLFCVLTTNLEESNFPYSSLVAFLNSEDLESIYFVTSRNTTKFTNLISDPKVCIFFDNRTNELDDVSNAVTATVLGKVEELKKEDNNEILEKFIQKYPKLKEFVYDRRTAFLQIKVREYIIVYDFQKVLKLKFS